MESDLPARVDTARAALAHACELLLDPTPQNLSEGSEELASVAAALSACRDELSAHRGDRDLQERLIDLRREFLLGKVLLATAEEYHSTWLGILCAKERGYTAAGDPAAMSAGARVCLRG